MLTAFFVFWKLYQCNAKKAKHCSSLCVVYWTYVNCFMPMQLITLSTVCRQNHTDDRD